MSKHVPHQQKIGFACPHCGGPTRSRTSRAVSEFFRQAVIACLDAEHCGASYAVDHVITHQLSPSLSPSAKVLAELRQTPVRVRVPANDTHPLAPGEILARGPEVPPPPAANDDTAPDALSL
ncbi:ogr/Delta-like zinc finger family protein [Sphingomonas sp. ac-8]|uniref:ogr/Delta-like zinc finger family protein n=1 Tax=Sphingomonas sp. ac-8 TaxID=3242977 RepID=UPI003A7F8B23